MVAALDDVSADPAVIADAVSDAECPPDEDDRRDWREDVSAHVAALTVFTFAWHAYEAAGSEACAGGATARDKVPVRVRRLMGERPEVCASLRNFAGCHRFARDVCRRLPSLQGQIADVQGRYGLEGGAAAAELVRIFRNHVVHGGEPAAYPDRDALRRLYGSTRLLLLLVQALAVVALRSEARLVPIDVHDDGRGLAPAGLLLRELHLGRKLDGRPMDGSGP